MIHVIGFHSRPLTPPAHLALIEGADFLVGGERHLAAFPDFSGPKIKITPLAKVLDFLKTHQDQEVALLASGDPLFFGIGRKLLEFIPREKLAFYPAPTAFQLAFARLKISWEDARIISLHGRRPQNLHLEISPYEKVAFFTDPQNTPAAIASYLVNKGVTGRAFVCENLGLAEERIREMDLEEVSKQAFSPLNVMVLLKPACPRLLSFGLSEEAFFHEKGLITKSYLRAVAISKLKPFEEAVVWDLGAGSGAVGLELAGLCYRGQTYLVEKDPQRAKLCARNIARFKLDNVSLLMEPIKEALKTLPSPDLVFIGGGFRDILAEERLFLEKLKTTTRIVAHFVCLEHLLEAVGFFKEKGFKTNFEALWGARGKELPNQAHILSAENPVFILSARRE